MTTDRPRDVPAGSLSTTTAPRTDAPTAGFGVSAIAAPDTSTYVSPVDPPARRSRAVTVVGALLGVVAVVAMVVAYRVIVPPAVTAQAAPAAAADEAVREQPGTTVRWGDRHSYGDGLEIAVNPPQRYEPSRNATGAQDGVPVRVQVVITNRTDEAFRPNTLLATGTSGGREAVAIWDPDQAIGLTGPDVSVPAGASVHFWLGFAPEDPGDLELEVTPALYGYGPTVVRHG